MAAVEPASIAVKVNADFGDFASQLRGIANRLELRDLSTFLLNHLPEWPPRENFQSIRDMNDATKCSCGKKFADSLWWSMHVRDEYARRCDGKD